MNSFWVKQVLEILVMILTNWFDQAASTCVEGQLRWNKAAGEKGKS